MSMSGTAGRPRTPGKAALASWIGSALEYYDFFIYGTAAALVFGKIFFPASDPATGTLLALATFGVGWHGRSEPSSSVTWATSSGASGCSSSPCC